MKRYWPVVLGLLTTAPVGHRQNDPYKSADVWDGGTADTIWTPREERGPLQMELEIEFGGPSDSGPASERGLKQIARLSDGRFVIQGRSRGPRPGPVVVYGADGKYIRPLAPTGPGPGELQSPRNFEVDRLDTIRVFEPGKVSVFAPTLQFARAEPWSGFQGSRSVRLGASRWLIMGDLAENDSVPFPLYLTTSKGLVAKAGTRGRQITAFTVAPDVPGQVWFARQLGNRAPGFEIGMSDSLLSKLPTVFTRRPGRWTSRDTAKVGDDAGIQSGVIALVHRGQLRLLIVGWKPSKRGYEGTVYVEEVDLRTRKVRMAAPLQGEVPTANVGTDRVVTYREIGNDGFYTVQIWKVK